jgi:hypothetical protein
LAYSPNGARLATGTSGGQIRILETNTGSAIAGVQQAGSVHALAFSPDGTRLASSDGSAVRIREAITGQERFAFEHGGVVYALAFSPDGTRLASGGIDSAARISNIGAGEEIARLEHGGAAHALAFSPDGTQLAIGSGDGAVQVVAAVSDQVFSELCADRAGRNLTRDEWQRHFGDIESGSRPAPTGAPSPRAPRRARPREGSARALPAPGPTRAWTDRKRNLRLLLLGEERAAPEQIADCRRDRA